MLTASIAQTTAPVWWRGSFRTRLATHQVSTAASVTASRARPMPTPWARSISAAARLKKIDRRQQHVEQHQQRFAGGVGGALGPAALGPDADAGRRDDRRGGQQDAHVGPAASRTARRRPGAANSTSGCGMIAEEDRGRGGEQGRARAGTSGGRPRGRSGRPPARRRRSPGSPPARGSRLGTHPHRRHHPQVVGERDHRADRDEDRRARCSRLRPGPRSGRACR